MQMQRPTRPSSATRPSPLDLRLPRVTFAQRGDQRVANDVRSRLTVPSTTCILKKLCSLQFLRWWVAGIACAALGLVLLKVLVGLLSWPYSVATLLTTEICTVANFLLIDRWVFQHQRPTWKRLVQYHVANAVGFVFWWIAANAMHAAGVHYLLASLLGTILCAGLSLLADFLWIWREPQRGAGEALKAER